MSLISDFFKKVRRFARKSPEDKSKTLRILINRLAASVFRLRPHLFNLFIGYIPDSQAIFDKHPEFEYLFKGFTKNNVVNNAGDIARLWSLILNIKQIEHENIRGDFAELGVWRGNTAFVLAHFAHEMKRHLYLFDTFEGFSNEDIKGIDADVCPRCFEDTSISLVEKLLDKNLPYCTVVQGYFPRSVKPEHYGLTFAVVSLDCDLYEPMRSGLEFFYPRLSKGGILFLHDYSSGHWDGAKRAIDEFCQKSGEYIVCMPDKSGSAFLRKSG